ncbi:MAG: autotransporter domain-containing protein [Marivivens sp.]|nr:autotransporter domain-containing protein [Marivivens sp.]
MIKKVASAALSSAILLMMGTAAQAGHAFTQGSTNTPVWLQTGQAVFVEQFYSDETSTPGLVEDIGFGPADLIPTGADTATTAWSDFDAGDVLKVEIGDFSFTVAFDSDTTSCATYTYCGWSEDSFEPGDSTVPTYTSAPVFDLGWGNTILPAVDAFDSNTNSTLSLTELQAATTTQLGSTAAFFYTDIGLTTYDTGDSYYSSSNGYTLDTDNNGALSLIEITDYNSAMSSSSFTNPLMTHVASNFATIDTNSDNSLSQAELDAATVVYAFSIVDADNNGEISSAEMFSYVWNNSYDAFHANTDGVDGVFNDFGLTFTAVAGEFSLESYRIADAGGWNLHGSGSGPVNQTSVCIPPNCGPGNTGPNAAATAAVIANQHAVEREAMKQASNVLIGVSELQVDVNFNGFTPRGASISTRGASVSEDMYRWAVRADGSFATNNDLGDTKTGSLVLAYALTADTDLGFYAARRTADLALGDSAFEGTIDAYGLYLRNRDDSGLGAQWKISLAGSTGDATLTRTATTDGAETATGVADLTGRTASVEVGYGKDVDNVLYTPYARLSYAKMTRGAYTEASTATAPLSFSEYTQESTTLNIGISAEHDIDDRNTVVSAIRATHDLNRSSSGQAGTSSIAGLTDWNLSTEDQLNPTRIGVDVTVYHDLNDGGRIYGGLSAQKEANVDAATVSVNFGFEARF